MNKKKSKSVKSLRYTDEFFSRCKIEAVIQRGTVKKVFLKILWNSQEKPCARVSFLIELNKKRQVFSCEYCNIFRNTFLMNSSGSKIRTKSLKLAKFQFQLFLNHGLNCKTRYPQKIKNVRSHMTQDLGDTHLL